ncbi:MAG: isoamylase early set domain-containing protein [Bacteroidetes bacterium]|nr:isoamylase early set domain-containing protein [Bacteroidota bacterium]
MISKRQYLKTKPACKVTFQLSTEAKHVALVGEFNGWNEASTPMKKSKEGAFSVSLELETGREYQYRYLVDGSNWINDENADKFVKTPLGNDNSVIVL